MKIKNFDMSVVEKYKMFCLLDKIPSHVEQIDILVKTADGYQPVDFVDVFKTEDDFLFAAWNHPFKYLPLQSLLAKSGSAEQVVNLYSVERILEFFNKSKDSFSGVFTFTDSVLLDSGDWRCERGYYATKGFYPDIINPVANSFEEVKFYEPFLCVPGVGNIVYIERNNVSSLAQEKLNNSHYPTTAKTLQEILRLVYEWYILFEFPFFSTDKPATVARHYFNFLNLSSSEIEVLARLPYMQVSNYFLGSTSARKAPEQYPELSKEVFDIVLSRMSCSSLSWILSGSSVVDDVYLKEIEELELGIRRFKDYYGVPHFVDLNDESMSEYALSRRPLEQSYIHSQIRNFKNKTRMLKIAAGNENLI